MSVPKCLQWVRNAAESSRLAMAGLLAAMCLASGCSQEPAKSDPAASPTTEAQLATPPTPTAPVKLIFIHHSCGENWLSDSNGGLGKALAQNNYFVSDTNYGWGPNGIGDRTDITNWPEWFTGLRSREHLDALYSETEQHCQYTRIAEDPGGENRIVMFKSCFPNSNLEGKPTDPPLRGEGLTVANAKAIYQELRTYFSTRPDRLFIAVTAPPVQDATWAANARAFNQWLVEEWLADYKGNNVAVFDFYNVLTGPENHHRLVGGKPEHTFHPGKNTLAYPSDDDHPSRDGNQKATKEFVPLLGSWYATWAGASGQTATPDKPAAGLASPPEAPEVPSSPGVPPETSPASATKAIEDYEGNLSNWAAFLDEGKETRLTFTLDQQIKRAGSASLRIQYDLAADSWAACSQVYDRPRDWSGSEGMCLYLHVEQKGQPITVVAYGGKSSEDLLHFERTIEAGQEAVDGWQRIQILWSQLRLPEWQGDAKQKYDPSSAMGMGFTFQSGEAGRSGGSVWVDEVSLVFPDENAAPEE